MVGVPMRTKHPVETLNIVGTDRSLHHAHVGKLGASILLGQEVRKIGVN